MKKVLIIDDEDKLRTLLSKILTYEGFEVHQAADCRSALARMEHIEMDVILCDVKLPDGNGIDLSYELKKKYPLVEIILLTAYGNIPDSVQAIKNGAFDYITKGDDNQKIIPLINRAIEKSELSKRVDHLEKQLSSKYSFEKIIGDSPAIQNAIAMAKKVADLETAVLLTGETGTGKEVFAQSIHQESRRSNKNFVAINCAAFSKNLLESELFGHKAGSFSGALKDHKGLFEEANNGTIFLDEIGDLALDLQAKLLRVIESGEFYKVGDNKTTKVNVRLITATNKDLELEVERGNFREDLYYRISVFQIRLPSLRERNEDIEQLSLFFMQLFSNKVNKKVNKISPDCLTNLQQHEWKGNIRELKNIMERCVILAENETITSDLLPFEIQMSVPDSGTPDNLSAFNLGAMEKNHILKVLELTKGNKTKTAQILGIALTTLYRKLSDYHIS